MAHVNIYDHEIRERLLPEICVCCGEPADFWSRRRFERLPPWTILVFPVALVLTAISSRRWTVDLPVCGRHSDPWRSLDRFRRWLVGTFASGFVAIFFLMADRLNEPSSTILGLIALWLVFVVGLIVACVLSSLLSIRAAWLSANSITLTRVDRRFADALERQRRGENPVDDRISR
jgi:hypothetical protein